MMSRWQTLFSGRGSAADVQTQNPAQNRAGQNPAAQAPPSGLARSFIDPHALMRIKNLFLRAKVVVEGFFSGLHRSPFHGFSVEFSEYRTYSPGDDPRFLDWRLYARSDRYFIKRFEDETNLRCYLLVDQSRSMTFGSLEYNKAEYTVTLAATLAYFLATQRDATGLAVFDERMQEYLPARYRPGHLHHMMVALEKARLGGGKRTDIAAPLEQVAQVAAKRGVAVLLSDLLAPIEQLETHLGYLCSRGHEVIVLRILDPAETSLAFQAPSMFYDLESGKEIYIDPEDARREYLRRFQEHEAAIKTAAANLGIDYFSITTDQPLELALFDYLSARLHRGKTTLRRQR